MPETCIKRYCKMEMMLKDPRKLVAIATSTILIFTIPLFYCTFSQTSIDVFRIWEQGMSKWEDSAGIEGNTTNLDLNLRRLVRGEDRNQLLTEGISCHSNLHSDVCIVNRQAQIVPRARTVYIPSLATTTETNRVIKPYARKEDQGAMKLVKTVRIILQNSTNHSIFSPTCDFNHSITAVIFSSGGFTGNTFHELNEIIIPLYLTTRHFRSQVRFVITDYKTNWVRKYTRVLKQLSRYEVINAAKDASIHCFPGAIVGLTYHDNLALNYTGIPGGYSMIDFRRFLQQSYDLKAKHVSAISRVKKPKLLLLSRRKTRMILNEDEMVQVMEALGFDVKVAFPDEMRNLDKLTQMVNSCNIMVGVHGAGLTNELFLPSGAILIQIVPLGLKWLAEMYYGKPAKEMGLKYLEYRVKPDESSLIDVYGFDDPVIRDPISVFDKGYIAARAVYLDKQNLKINVGRFKETLVQALKLLNDLASS